MLLSHTLTIRGSDVASRILPSGLGEDDGHSNITGLGDFHRDLEAICLRLGTS